MQTTNKLHRTKFSYYLFSALKPAVFAFVLLIAFGSQVQSQIALSCGSISESPFDEVRIVSSIGKPADTIWVPVFLKNDSATSGFSMLIQWDSTKIKPIIIFDQIDQVSRLVTQFASRFVQISLTDPTDTITNFFAQLSQNPFDSGAIIAAYNLGLPPPDDTVFRTIEPGSGVIFSIAFELLPSMQHNDSGLIRFYEIQPVFVDNDGNPIVLDCRRTELSVEFGNVGFPITIYPQTFDGYIVADSAPGPTITEFLADPTTITEGNSFRLSYIVNNADSLLITGPGLNFFDSTEFIGNLILSPSSDASYLLTAWNVFDSVKATVNVTVVPDDGGGEPPPDVDAPSISFPQGSFHVIEQGQTVTFNVTASDPNAGDIVTLSAINLPANATFNTVVGSNTVTGSFSFTPDVTQEGTFVVQFVATDNGGSSSSANASITVEALEFDRLFSSSATGQDPIGGLKGTRNLVFPINLITSQEVVGIEFDMLYDRRAIRIDSLVGTSRIQNFTIFENIGDFPGEIKVVAFGTANETVAEDTSSSAIMNFYLTIDTGAIPWVDYIIDLVNGFESVKPDFASLEMVTEGGVVQVDKRGDVNLDRRINVADVVSIVAYIIGNFGLSPRQFEAADIIIDDVVNVFDLVGTINTIFGIPVSPVPPPPITTESATMSLSYQNLNPGQRGDMVVQSYLPEEIAAVELDIEFDPTVVVLLAPELATDAKDMTMQYKITGDGKMKILMHFKPSDSARQLPIGNLDMLVIPMYAQRYVNTGDESQLKIEGALLSTWNSASVAVEGISDGPLLPETFVLFQNYPNPFNPSTTIEFTIGLSSDGSGIQEVGLDIFNILGQRVNTLVDEKLPSGHYSIEWNSRSFSGHRVATGVYFYRLIVGSESETKKMLLIK